MVPSRLNVTVPKHFVYWNPLRPRLMHRANSTIRAESHRPPDLSSGDSQSTPRMRTLKLMPLGGSITYGQGSSDGNGYRNALHQMLLRDGFTVDFVGSRKAGSMENSENEGWRGFRIDQILDKARRSVPVCKPDIFVVNAGSNDCLQEFEIECVGARMDRLLEFIWMMCPWSTVILSTLIVSAHDRTESVVLAVNEQFRELVDKKVSEQKKIVLVDMHGTDGPSREELTDGTHPNDAGYFKMARLWREGIAEAVSKKYVEKSHTKLKGDSPYLQL